MYSRDLNIVICVGFSILPFYAINMDDVSLFTDSSFLFLANFHCIDVLYQFKRMNILYLSKKNRGPKLQLSLINIKFSSHKESKRNRN